MNKSILLGRLTKDADIRTTNKSNDLVANFTLAVNRNYVKEGEERQADFINIVAYSKLAEFVQKYLTKGMQICLCGRIQTRKYDDDKGQTHYITEVIAETIDFADSPKKTNDTSILNGSPSKQEEQTTEEIMGDDDLPF